MAFVIYPGSMPEGGGSWVKGPIQVEFTTFEVAVIHFMEKLPEARRDGGSIDHPQKGTIEYAEISAEYERLKAKRPPG